MPFNLPTNLGKADIQVFTNNTITGGDQVIPYKRPNGTQMLYVYTSSSGAGGGGGFTGIAGSGRGGGGGGGSGAIMTALFPFSELPDTLYLQVGRGGAGGSAGVAGTSGTHTQIMFVPGNVTTQNYLVRPAQTNAVGGGGGTAAAGGAGGAGATLITSTDAPYRQIGLFSNIGGQVGTSGGDDTGVVGTAIALPDTGINVMGGTGGGGTTSADFAGGLITAAAGSLISESRPANATAGSIGGSGGFSLSNFMFNYPGLGGGSSNTGVGGGGGGGGFGSGGGGGGGGTTGGRGGDGGSGLVIMIAF